LIFRGTTDEEGKFHGLSREWVDSNWVSIPSPFGPNGRVQIPDLIDLDFIVTKGGESHRGPFIHLAENLSAPIICPWNNPKPLFAKVDGKFFFDANAAQKKIIQLIKSNSKFELEIFDPVVRNALSPLANGKKVTRRFVEGRMSTMALEPVSSIGITLLAVAAIILVTGAAISVVLIGVAIILAIEKGCSPNVEKATGLDQDGQVQDTLKVQFRCPASQRTTPTIGLSRKPFQTLKKSKKHRKLEK